MAAADIDQRLPVAIRQAAPGLFPTLLQPLPDEEAWNPTEVPVTHHLSGSLGEQVAAAAG